MDINIVRVEKITEELADQYAEEQHMSSSNTYHKSSTHTYLIRILSSLPYGESSCRG